MRAVKTTVASCARAVYRAIGREGRLACPRGQSVAAMALVVLTAVAPAAGASRNEPAWRVLILDSTDSSEPVAQSFDQEVREVLTERAAHPVDFYTEFLDALRFQGAFHENELVAFLTRKYADRRPDIIVTVFPEAFAFIERHRAELLPFTSVVFVGVPDDLLRARVPGPGMTGVLTRVDFPGTLELALRLQPGTKRVAVVTGATDFDRWWRVRAEAALKTYAGRLEAQYLDALPIPDLLQAVAALPPGTIVLHSTVYRDGAGNPTQPRDVMRQVAQASSVPVYGTFEPSLGTGVVGASIVPLAAQGRRAGELALRIMNGEQAGLIPIEAWPLPRATVDWRQMRRFGFGEALLPPGAVVLFRPTSIWDQYRGRIIGGAALLVLQSVLIVALLIERRQRRRAELHAQQQRVELAHASRLATVGEITASIAHQVNQPLGAILTNADTAEILLDADPVPLDDLRQIIADIKRDDERASDVIRGMRGLLLKREGPMEPIDINAIVSEIRPLLAGEARRRAATLEFVLSDGLPRVTGNRVHLQQVVLNLVMNALDAVGDEPSETRRAVQIGTAWTGAELVVVVTDTGPGMPPERLSRVFESFFTTQRNGMGLGRSIARSLIQAHDGRIWAENNQGSGATFGFALPAAVGSLATHEHPVRASKADATPIRQTL